MMRLVRSSMDETDQTDEQPPTTLDGSSERLTQVEFAVGQQKGWRQELPQLAALALATAVHLMLLILIMPAASEVVGEEGNQLESIAVEIVLSAPIAVAVPQLLPPTMQPEVAAEAPPDSGEERPHQEKEQLAKADQTTLAPEPELELQEISPIKLALPETKPTNEEASDRASHGSLEAVGAQPPPASAAPASQGAIQAYARKIALALGKSRPKGAGLNGTVKVRFLIGLDGVLEGVEVVVPSGKPPLDQIAIAAIKRNTFPPPPVGSSEKDRTFVVPYSFR